MSGKGFETLSCCPPLLLVLSAGEKAPNSCTGIVDLSGSGVLTGCANLEVGKSCFEAVELESESISFKEDRSHAS